VVHEYIHPELRISARILKQSGFGVGDVVVVISPKAGAIVATVEVREAHTPEHRSGTEPSAQ